MCNLLYSEFYKLRKDFGFRIMAVLAVFFTFMQYGMNVVMETILRRGGAAGEQEQILDGIEQTGILDILHSMFGNTNAIIFATIFVCTFVIIDYSSGMTANFVGKGYRRTEVFLAKFFVAQFGAVMLYVLTALATLLFGMVFEKTGGLDAAFFHDFFNYLALHILYLTAYTAVIILVCTLTRNMAVGILVSILLVMMFSNFIVQALDLACSYLGVEVQVSQYWIVTIIASCPVRDIPSRFIVVSGIAAVFWLVASMAAGIFLFEKRDVR